MHMMHILHENFYRLIVRHLNRKLIRLSSVKIQNLFQCVGIVKCKEIYVHLLRIHLLTIQLTALWRHIFMKAHNPSYELFCRFTPFSFWNFKELIPLH